MRKIIPFFLIVLASQTLHGQDRSSLSMPGQNEWRFLSFFLRSPDPKLADDLFIQYQNEDYNKIYKNADGVLKSLQSPEDIRHYFTLLQNNCGKLRHFEQSRFSFFKSGISKRKLASATYKLEFDSVRAEAMVLYHVKNSRKIRLNSLVLTFDSTFKIAELDSQVETAMKLLTTKDYASLYSITSATFKAKTPTPDYETFIEKIDTIDLETNKLVATQFALMNGQYVYVLTYSVGKSKEKIKLIYSRTNGVFELTGINYQP